MAGLWRLILSHKMFTRYLVLTNVLVSGAIDGLGDFIEQKLEHQDPIIWQRTGRMSVIGLAMGLPDHFWYKFIDRLYPRRTPGAVARKVALDILIMGPPHITAFYIGMCKMEGKTWRESIEELKKKFLTTFLLECAVWPPLQAVNFLYLPTSLRVVYVSMIDLGWAVVLSRLKHKEESGTESGQSLLSHSDSGRGKADR